MENRRGIGMVAGLAAAYGALAAGSNGHMRIHDPSQKRYSKSNRLNRSNKWLRAETYKEARDMSPNPERPVR